MADKGILETGSPPRQRIDVRSLNDVIPVTSNRADRLVIRKEEHNVWWGVRETGTDRQNQDWQQQQKPSVHYFAIFLGGESETPIVAAFEGSRFIQSGLALRGEFLQFPILLWRIQVLRCE